MTKPLARTGWSVLLVLYLLVPAASQAQVHDPATELLLSIDDAVKLALERSRDLRDAQLLLEEAREQVAEFWGRVLPQVDFSASYVRNISPAVAFVPARAFDLTASEDEFVSLQFGADNSWQSSIRVEQPLFDPALLVGVDTAQRYALLQREVVRGRSQEVAVRVRLICYDLLLRTEEVRLTQRSLERVRQALAETQARHRAGMTTEYDVLRLQVELANLEPGLLRAHNDVDAARRQLAVELDIANPRRLQLTPSVALTDTSGPASVVALAQDSVSTLITTALGRRSDMRQLAGLTDLRQADLRLQKAGYLPTVSLFGSWDVQAQQNGSLDFFGDQRSRATSKLAGVRIDLPLFTGLQRQARISQRRSNLRQVQIQSQLSSDLAAAQVRDLLARRDQNAARVQAQRLAVHHAERGFQIALARYHRGVGSQLEVTDAEVALRRSEFNHAQAAHDLLATRARLELATGQVPGVP